MPFISALYKLLVAEVEQLNPSDVILEFGKSAFSTTDTDVEVNTKLTDIIFADALPIDPTYGASANDHMYCDGVITSGAVTFSRGASGKSGMEFWYILIGRVNNAVE